MECTKHVARIKSPAHSASHAASRVRREHETRLDPVRPGLQSFLKLSASMYLERLYADLREYQCPATLLGLERLEHEPISHTLQLLPESDFPALKIHIIPAKPRRLAESKAAGEGHGEQRSESMRAGYLQKCSGLFKRKRPNRAPARRRNPDKRRRIHGHEL